MPRGKITGIVLAGGLGRRLGGVDKGLQELRGRPLVAHVIERFAPQVDELLINANRNRERYAAFGQRVVADLIPEALRQNLSRLIVGEVRGVEAGAMFEAMQAGAGTMSTTHSHSAASTMDRLASRVAQGGVLTVEEAFRQIAHHLHLLVHVRLIDETWRGGVRTRHVAEIRHLTGAIENGRPITHLVYRAPDLSGRGELLHIDASLAEQLEPFQGGWESS